MERRTFLRGLAGLIAAPAIIRTPGLIMPVKAMSPIVLDDDYLTATERRIIVSAGLTPTFGLSGARAFLRPGEGFYFDSGQWVRFLG